MAVSKCVRKALSLERFASLLKFAFATFVRNSCADSEERAHSRRVRTSAISVALSGPVMRAMLARFSGQVEGGTINRLAREVLAG